VDAMEPVDGGKGASLDFAYADIPHFSRSTGKSFLLELA
jgi:hypothetical protein